MPKHPDSKNKATSFLEWLGIGPNHDWSKARPLGIAIGVGFSIFLLVSLPIAAIAVPVVIWGTIRDVLNHSAGGPNLGAGALITAVLGAPFLIWSTVIKHRTLGFQKEGHLTDRISKAVEQLGAEKTVKRDGVERSEPNIEVRIGGILSLERIAQDSTTYDKGRDHVRCMEILCAYIRENAPAREAKDHGFGEWEPLAKDATSQQRAAHVTRRKLRLMGPGIVSFWARDIAGPRADIALALRVIGRRDADQRAVEARWGKDADANATWVFEETCPPCPESKNAAISWHELEEYRKKLAAWSRKMNSFRGYRLDLRKTNLQRADLSGLVLSGANLRETRLEGANLANSWLQSAKLYRARLDGASLQKAWMQGASFQEASMEATGFWGAQMEWSNLSLVRMVGARFMSAGMDFAHLGSAQMEEVSLYEARLLGAHLGEAQIDGADLSRSRLEGAYLVGAKMAGAQLDSASLLGAALQNTDCASLTADQVNACFGDGSVTLPRNMNTPKHWPRTILGDQYISEWRKWQASPETYEPPTA